MTNDEMNECPSRPVLDADEAAALQALGWRGGAGASGCPDSSLLLPADDGVLDELDEDVASRVRSHASTCSTCQQLTRDLTVVLSEAPTAAEADRIGARLRGGPAGRRAYWWFGAAGVALAAGLAWLIVAPRSSSAPPPRPDLQLAQATPSVFVVDRPSMPPGEIELTVRGDAPVQASLEMQIAAALDRADAGDVAGALASLEATVRDHRDSSAAALALGAVQLRIDRNVDAVATLERARTLKSDQAHADEVGWFFGIALVRTGNRDRARSLLDEVCKHGGPRSAQACAGVAELSRAPASR